MKYIIFESSLKGIFPVVFPDVVDHSFIASSVRERYPGVKATSAGFCTVGIWQHGQDEARITVSAWGRSITLKLRSHPDDVAVLEQLLSRNGL